jgi:two-component system, NarL family, nitrate/nitrite response regulator NarL
MIGATAQKLRFLLADDHELLRDAVRPLLLKISPEARVVEASTYDQVTEILGSNGSGQDRFDLILLDLGMPGADDADVLMGVRRVRGLAPDTPLVIFSSTENPAIIRNSFTLGVRGYVPKTTRGLAFIRAINLVLDGDLFIPAAMLATEAAGLSASPTPAPVVPPLAARDPLTDREAGCLSLLVKGIPNKEIGRTLGIQDATVKMHLRNAYRKIGARNRIDAVRIVTESGLALP